MCCTDEGWKVKIYSKRFILMRKEEENPMTDESGKGGILPSVL
jgi:hypothetical protein